jgi:hypothetical protein
MTREEAIAAAPFTQREYWVQLVFLVFYAGAVAFALWAMHIQNVAAKSCEGAITFLGIGLVLVSTAQGLERLISPIRAAERSASFALRLNGAVKRIFRAVQVVSIVYQCSIAILLISHPRSRYLLLVLCSCSWLMTQIFRDLVGRRAEEEAGTWPQPRDSNEWKALHSDHWGVTDRFNARS